MAVMTTAYFSYRVEVICMLALAVAFVLGAVAMHVAKKVL